MPLHAVAGVGGDAGPGDAAALIRAADRGRRARRELTRDARAVRAGHRRARPAADQRARRATPRWCCADGTIEGFVGGTCARGVGARCTALRRCSRPASRCCCGSCPATARRPSAEDGAVTVANPCLSRRRAGDLPRAAAARAAGASSSATRPIAERAGRRSAAPLGFDVELVAGEQAQPAAGDAALVVASHGRGEEPALTAALRAGVPYVGLVASRTAGAAVLAALDVTDEQRGRVHSPAGLDIGGRTAAEIALSILAELVAERRAAERHAPRRGAPAHRRSTRSAA